MSKNLLRALLAEYASDGEWDTSGKFTIDSARSMQILARYQSSNPDLFLLHWVRFAYLCGARSTTITLEKHRLILRHDGTWPPMPNWLVFWGIDQGNERALAFCLWNALRLRFGEAQLFYGDKCLHLDRGLQGKIEDCPKTSEIPFLALLLPVATKQKGNEPKGPTFPALGDAQRPLLSERCCYSPVSISYLGQLVPSAGRVPCAIHTIFKGPYEAPDIRYPAPETVEPQTLSTKDPYFASVYLGAKDGREGLTLILDGVAYPTLAPWGLPGLFVIVGTPDLHLDISGEHLVRSKTVDNLTEWLVRDLDNFFRRTINQIDAAPAGLVPYLEALISVRLQAGDYKSAYEICRWVALKISARKIEFFNAWQRANFFYRFALVSVMMNDPQGAKTLVNQAERVWAQAEMKDIRFMPKAVLPEGELSREERILFCRLAIEEQTLEKGIERVRQVLLEQSELYIQARRWNLVSYCQRWLLEIEPMQRGRGKRLAIRRAMVGVSLLNHLRQKAMAVSQDWYEAQIYLNQALRGWRTQLERQTEIDQDDRATLLDIIDAHVHIHIALGQWEGARKMTEVWLDEQLAAPKYQLEACLEHLRRLKGMLGPQEGAEAAAIEERTKVVKKAIKEQRGPVRDLFSRFFGLK